MYDINKACLKISSLLDQLEDNAPEIVDDHLVIALNLLNDRLNNVRDSYFKKFDDTFDWAQGGYSSAAQALSHMTKGSLSKTKKALDRAELIDKYELVRDCIKNNEITPDHLDSLLPIFKDALYGPYLEKDIEHILENAKVLTASGFNLTLRHWKYIVQDLEDNISEKTLTQFERRFMSIWQTPSGDWNLEGRLDPLCGEIFNKSLESIRGKMYRNSSKEERSDYELRQANVDALAALSRGYLANDNDALEETDEEIKEYSFTPPLTADIVIDVTQLKSYTSTTSFLKDCATSKTPLARAHSKKYLEELHCDSTVSFPVKNLDGKIDLGRKVRVAPQNMKRKLALESNQCSVEGCGIPARWCDAHHVRHWVDGGETKIENLVLLCRRHHTKVHNDKYFEEKLSYSIEKLRKPDQIPIYHLETG